MTDRTAQAHLELVYYGPALVDGSMNVRDLAPAMMALGSFFEVANRISNGQNTSISVNVRATSASSFHVAFEVFQNLQAMEVLGIDDFLTTANALKGLLLGGGTGGLLALIKLLRGRKPQITKVNADLYKLTVDGQTYEVPMVLLRLYQEVQIRRNIQDMVKPVKEPGIDRLVFHSDGQIAQEVTKREVEAFDIPESQVLILDQVRQQAFSIVSLAFIENNKWRLTDGQSHFSVSMKDEEFQRRVDKQRDSIR